MQSLKKIHAWAQMQVPLSIEYCVYLAKCEVLIRPLIWFYIICPWTDSFPILGMYADFLSFYLNERGPRRILQKSIILLRSLKCFN